MGQTDIYDAEGSRNEVVLGPSPNRNLRRYSTRGLGQRIPRWKPGGKTIQQESTGLGGRCAASLDDTIEAESPLGDFSSL